MSDAQPQSDAAPSEPSPPSTLTRRAILAAGGAALAGGLGYPLIKGLVRPKAGVFIARNQTYDGSLVRTISDGLQAAGLDPATVKGKRVLLKPNLVEPTRKSPHMTTHPRMVLAAAEVFRTWGATVKVGEGPGHVRDTEYALIESNLLEALDDARLEFADLNYEEVGWVPNRGQLSRLQGFYFPRSVLEADLIVSMPKMKTHHHVGFTCSMKNLYGTIPGIKYGWPKNVLHRAGIPETVFDINSSLPPAIAIVDGITCMEGDGPIMGSPKQMGLVVVGLNRTSVDATVARIMGLLPERVAYLQYSADRLGPIDERRIRQRGESWQSVKSPFKIINEPFLQRLRMDAVT